MPLVFKCGICHLALSGKLIEELGGLIHISCGHVFHGDCIRRYTLATADTDGTFPCPKCKERCTGGNRNLIRLYPIISNQTQQVDDMEVELAPDPVALAPAPSEAEQGRSTNKYWIAISLAIACVIFAYCIGFK